MGRRVLVLGATSYVAQYVLRRFLAGEDNGGAVSEMACTVRGHPQASELPEGLELGLAGATSARRRVRVFPGVTFANMDSLRACMETFRPDVVLNCIAMASPAACEKNLGLSTAINEPHDLVELVREFASPHAHLVHFSTDFVYHGDQPTGSAYREEDASLESATHLSVYGASKLRFDSFLAEQPPPGGCSVLRIANVVGGRAPLFTVRANPAPKFMEWLHAELFSSGANQPPLKLWSDEYRSFIFIRDLVDIIYALFTRTEVLIGQTRILNVGGRDALTRVALAQKYLEAGDANHHSTRKVVPTKRELVNLGYHSPLDSRLDTARLDKLLPELQRTPTSEFLAIISRELSAAARS